MSQFLCKKHGVQNLIATSPKIAKSVNNESQTFEIDIVLLKIISTENNLTYYVDHEFLDEFIPDRIEKEATLKNRDKQNKVLNDRVLILKIFKKCRRLALNVCKSP